MVVKNIQIYGVRITVKCIFNSKKLQLDIFTSSGKTLSLPYHQTQAEGVEEN